MKTRCTLIALLIVFSATLINAQEKLISIKGIVYCEDKLTGALQDVNIYNVNKSWGTSSDVSGLFEIKLGKQDTIYFSSIQHIEEKFYISDSVEFVDQFIEIVMMQDTTWLEVVTVIGFPTYEKFKQELLSLDLPSNDIFIARSIINKYAKFDYNAGDMELKIPLTYLYKKYVRILKRKKKNKSPK